MVVGDGGDKHIVYYTGEELIEGFVGGVVLFVELGSSGVSLADGGDLWSCLVRWDDCVWDCIDWSNKRCIAEGVEDN